MAVAQEVEGATYKSEVGSLIPGYSSLRAKIAYTEPQVALQCICQSMNACEC